MRIGNPGDPGLNALLGGHEGGDLIIPPTVRAGLSVSTAGSVPAYNIRAGVGYLLMRMANFVFKSVPDADTKIYDVTVKAGDSIDRIAKAQGSTPEVMKRLNPTAHLLKVGQILKYQKASVQKVIAGWKPLTSASIQVRYNIGDPKYASKLDYALAAVRKRKVEKCK